jgi:hypothetical protein
MMRVQRFIDMHIRKLLLAGILAVSIFVGSGALVGAQGSGGSGIQIIPTRTEITISPGEIRDVTLTLKNVTRSPIIAKGFIHDFEPDNVTGEPQIIVDPNTKSDFSLKDYIRGLQDYELQPNETKDVVIQFSIPPDAAPGGYFGAIRYAAVPKEQIESEGERTVALTASVASLVLIEIPGDVTESVRVDKVAVELGGQERSFFMQAPDKASIQISNTGNSFVKPFGIVTVKRGNKEVYSYQLNNTGQRGNVLPKSSRTFKDDIKNVNTFGKYVITANVSYTDGGDVITVNKTFWVIPLWALIVAGVLLLFIILLILFIGLRLRSRQHRVRR